MPWLGKHSQLRSIPSSPEAAEVLDVPLVVRDYPLACFSAQMLMQEQFWHSQPRAQSLLDALLGARDEGGVAMGRRALRDELMTLLVAGQETAAIALGWACALLAHHPAAQVPRV